MVCVMVMRNALLVWFLVFGMLCMGTILLSSASSELDSNNTMVNNNNKCIETERLALLDIKQGLADTYGSLSSWGSSKDDENCCQWSLLECDSDTGHVTHLHLSSLNDGDTNDASNISSSLLLLRNLQYLDLSYNGFDIPIPSFFGSLPNLVHLDLSGCHFQGAIPDELGNLSKLSFLDLSYNQLEGMISNSVRNLSSLQTVDFSQNNLTGNLQDLLYMLPEATLQTLSISENQLTGSLPDITAFSFLEELLVDYNQLNGFLPKEFKHKSVLTILSLSNNYLRGSLPDFSGFSFLQGLYLNDNKFSGSVPDFDGCSALESLYLPGNQLTGWETQSIGQLTNLVRLDLSRNSINSTINEHHLSELYNLNQMNASFNSLTFNMSSDWLPPFKLDHLLLASCKLGPKFPIWIRNQTEISLLDFSSTQISDTIPMWFWDNFTKIIKLDLSSNKISGTLSSIPLHIDEINLSSNYFEGPLPRIPTICSEINLSHNNFSGELVLSAAEVMSLRFLDLSHNLLFGEIPDSWKYFEDLIFLNLGNNNFSGRIPMSIRYLHSLNKLILRNNKLYGEFPESLRNCTELGFVDVGLNGLSGTVPAWIGKDLPQLYALVLKSNKFYGSLPDDLCYLSHLHFLDLSMNRLSGNVPQCFSRLIAMTNNGTGTTDHHNNRILSASSDRRNPYNRGCSKITRCRSNSGDVSYLDEALAGWKGKEREFRGNFASLNMIDLSSNKFTGEFPTGIARLLDLKGLNLSRNQFYGKVPVQIGRLFELEVLDLSSNNFSGDIPRSMTGLTFLAYLDLSSNNFSARIPLGGQLQAFNSSMYEGNPGLCGLPLTKRCPGDKTRVEVPPPSNGNEVDEDEILYERWLYISTALGFSTSFWGICVTLLVNRRWRHAYFLFLTNLKDQLYVFIIVHIARLKVRLQG
ncbi:receptor-like protein EIX2 isoform X1 [Daucus carota subsp. sativus]|nr:PREDICTED: LRR receptor-like serine/threonine-protein kinase GSO1 isoform X2 [Daucus carota subsp. sativus]